MSEPTTPALPVTFRPGRTRAVLLTVGIAMFATVTLVAMMLEKLGPGSAPASSSRPRSSSGSSSC